MATGEPLHVAGAFTLEGFGAAWIESIDGNYGGVTGLSIPVLRRLLSRLGVELDRPLGRPGTPGPGQVPSRRRLPVPDEFRARVQAVVARLGPGEVVSYGDVAAEAGFPGAARGRRDPILAHPHIRRGDDLPWWRVVTAAGRLVPGHEAEHARRLRAEGIEIVAGRVARPARPPAARGRGASGRRPSGGPTGSVDRAWIWIGHCRPPGRSATSRRGRCRTRWCISLLDTARYAPSGGNRQAWHVVLVKDPELRARLRDLYLRGWYEYLAMRRPVWCPGRRRPTARPSGWRWPTPPG